MSQSVVFSTPGLIPIEAFTVFGMNAKPNSVNPFGFFGTGLKIGIAVCIRNGLEVIIYRGKDKYTFYTKPQDFRGKEFGRIRMKLEKPTLRNVFQKSYHELPFTTELGKHWELWQAFREFQTNTMDEDGRTHLEHHGMQYHIAADQSHILVKGQKFVDEYHDRHRNFLEDGLTERQNDERIQVLDRPSRHVYYRSVRVMDLKEEAKYTYNFLETIDLTEDRTAKHPWLLETRICELIMQSKDKKFLSNTTSYGSGWEGSLGYNYTSVAPSKEFVAVARVSPNSAIKKLVEAQVATPTSTRLLLTIPKPYIEDDELSQIEQFLRDIFGDITLETQG